ncbi:MAG TPA: hypothetical protein PKO22_10225 [Treponemataceae bacterium]|nr:hypothetical protein [Treponemataceae bacterium]
MTDESAARLAHLYRQSGDIHLLEQAVSCLASYLYVNLKRYRLPNMDEDLRSDFIAWLYPRLPSVIRQFNPEKASFNTYVNWVVRLSFRTFLKNKYSMEARQRVYEIEETTRLLSVEAEIGADSDWDSCTADANPDYGDILSRVKFSELSEKKRAILSRKVLLLACKASNYIDERSIRRVALIAGLSVEYIREKIDILREKTLEKHDRDVKTAERINGYYIRAQRCLFEMKYMDRDTARYLSLGKEYAFCLKRIQTIRKNDSRRIRTPSNRLLATTLGISRGTIDSTLASTHADGYSESP